MHNKYLIIFAVLILSTITSFWMLTSQALNSHECFVSVTAREMLQNHDYVWPTLNGISRLQKSPLSYWLVGGMAKITGTVDEFSARFPSALFAVFSAMIILCYLTKWLSLRIASISSAVWATSFAFIRCSHNARPDTAMTFFILLCLMSFYSIVIAQDRRSQIINGLIFWISFALANLAKGPAPVVYVFVPITVYIIFSKKWRTIPKMLPVIGCFICLVVVVPWFLFIAQRLNWDLTLWKHEYFDRLSGDYAPGNYPFYYYLPDSFKYFTPWIVFLPLALFTPFYKVWENKRPVITYLWIWFVADFIFLTIDGGKRQHYILPLIPPMAMLTGIILEDMIFSKKAYTHVFIKNILLVHTVILITLALVSPVVIAFIVPALILKVISLSITILIFLILTLILFARKKSQLATVSIFFGIAAFIVICTYNFSSVVDEDCDTRDFAKKISCIVPDSDKLVSFGNVSSRFVQYYGQVVPEVNDMTKLKEYYVKDCWIICLSGNQTVLKDENFNIVFSTETKEDEKPDTAGQLFHRSSNDPNQVVKK